jgi:acyl-CoA synthetase (AMP-forming)/AMP-acid ligase II
LLPRTRATYERERMSLGEARLRVAGVAAERGRRFRASRAWRGASLADSLALTSARRPDALALVDGVERLDFAALLERVLRLAGALEHLGVAAGDAVAYQLPNWWETATTCLAALAVGAHAVPIVPILGEREIAFILAETRPRLLFVPARHRGVDYAARAEAAIAALGVDRPRIVVVRGEAAPAPGPRSPAPDPSASARLDFAALLAAGSAVAGSRPVDASGLAVVLYTSGTTAAPKGVLHSHETLASEVASLVDAHGLGEGDRTLMPSPLTHVSGLIHGILCPVLLGTSAVLMERWDPGEALAAIERHRVTYLAGAPTFLQEILAHDDVGRRDLSSLRLYTCGGASVPPELLRLARERIPGMVAKRSYGSSEFPTIATTTAADALEHGLDSEGRALTQVEIRITDEAGGLLPPGREGEIRARGPECFLGYTDASLDRESFDGDGFFRTGDLGTLDHDGYLRITGRVKDIIIRKGEKISAREVEDLLAELPGVAEVAVVPVADPVTGERACACLLMKKAASPVDLATVASFLRERGLTPQKLPEQLERVDDFPRTPSGKIHKRLLRERIEAASAARDRPPPETLGRS